jgi:elongation factor G
MVARSIEPSNHADDAKLSTALKRTAAEDPTFVYERDEATGQLVARGMSLMHLETVLRRIKDRQHVEVKVDLPRVPLRETVTRQGDGHHRHKKQTGGRGQFAEVYLTVEAAARGAGLVFEDDTVGGTVPKQFIPAIEKGVREQMQKGVIAGYPVVDVTVRVTDGKFHDVDSDEASFKMAGGRAFRDGFAKAHPVLLEPLLDMEVAVPSRFMGAITSDLTGRRGHITGMDSLGDMQLVKVRVPQREVLTYPTALGSLTHGEGSFTTALHDYEVVPPNIQHEIQAGFKPAHDED